MELFQSLVLTTLQQLVEQPAEHKHYYYQYSFSVIAQNVTKLNL